MLAFESFNVCFLFAIQINQAINELEETFELAEPGKGYEVCSKVLLKKKE